MQKVAWPSTMVQKLNGTPPRAKAARSEMPVTMPGKAIGSRISRVTDSLPKKRKRYIAAAAQVPRISAIDIENRATRTDSQSASQKSSRPRVTANHCVVRPGGGKE